MIKAPIQRTNRKITDFGDGYLKSRPDDEDWDHSAWSGASAQPVQAVKRKRGPPKKEKQPPKQTKLEQMTLVYIFVIEYIIIIIKIYSTK